MVKMKSGMCIVICTLDGKPYVMQNSDDEPMIQGSRDKAAKWVEKYTEHHILLRAADRIIILNIDTGESEIYLD